ncbi:hypothetical protein PO909_000493 [Leuciscus waleckii]
MKNVFSVCVFCFVIEGVFDVDPDEVKTAIEGDSLTLQADFTETQRDGLAEWRVNETRIATINKATGKVEYSDVQLMFSGRLNLDQTGFLTLWNVRIKHSGEYTVESISSVGTKSKTFRVIVKESPLKSVEDNEEIKALLATKGNSETLHTDTELQKRDLILWRFGAEGSLIAKGDTEDDHASHYDGDDGRFRNRLKMDINTGSLTISDLETEHAGEFRLKIISDRRILFKRFTVTVSVPGLPPGVVAGICVVLMLAAVAAAAGVGIYCRRRDSELKKLIPEISKQLEQLPKISKQLEQLSKLSKHLSEINETELAKGCENEIGKISEKLKKMSEDCKKEIPEISKQLEQLKEEKISERLSEISENIKKVFESKKPENPEQLPLTGEEETSEQEIHADVTQEEASRSEMEKGADVSKMEKGEGERRMIVTETALSRAIGANMTSIDRQGRRSIAIRNPSTKRAGDQGSDGKARQNELKELKEVLTGVEETSEQEIPLTDELENSEKEICADVSKMEKGEGERRMIVAETALSQVMGANKTFIDRQGRRSIAIRNPSTKRPGDQGRETPPISQTDEDGENEQ